MESVAHCESQKRGRISLLLTLPEPRGARRYCELSQSGWSLLRPSPVTGCRVGAHRRDCSCLEAITARQNNKAKEPGCPLLPFQRSPLPLTLPELAVGLEKTVAVSAGLLELWRHFFLSAEHMLWMIPMTWGRDNEVAEVWQLLQLGEDKATKAPTTSHGLRPFPPSTSHCQQCLVAGDSTGTS